MCSIKIKSLSLFLLLYGLISAQISTEEEVITSALMHYPSVQVSDQRVLYHKALERTAFNPAQPQATIEAPGDVGPGFEIQQQFDFPGVYRSQSRLLKRQTLLAGEAADLTRIELRRSVRLAFLDAQVAEASILLLSKQDSIWQEIARSSQRHFDAGEINKAELLFAQTQAGQVSNQIARSGTEAEIALAQLSMLAGQQIQSTTPLRILLDVISDSTQSFYFEDYVTAQAKVAESEIAVQKSERYPGIIVGYLRVPELDTDFRTRFKAGITVPIWQGQYKGQIAAARAASDQTRAEVELQRTQAQTMYQQLLKTLVQSRTALAWYIETALPMTDAFLETSIRLFDAGETNNIMLLRSISDALDTQSQYLEEVRRHNRALIDLDFLTGR
jgi:cobalt-zinc-cadmium resistance protein CzcA